MTEKKRTRWIWIESVRKDPLDILLAGRALVGAAADEAQKEADAQAQANEQAQLKGAGPPHEEDAS